ncbi:MAG: hypothetical protein V1674_03625 [Candidatus Omnitrophota bacterium]
MKLRYWGPLVCLQLCLGCAIVKGPISNKPYYSLENPDYKKELLEFKRGDYVRRHPGLRADIRASILNGQIVLGMNQEQVKASLGEPSQVYRSVSGNIINEQWVYEPDVDKTEAEFARSRILYFDNGILKSCQD